jgi:hypothetical protein
MTMWVIGTEKLVTEAYAYSIASPIHNAYSALHPLSAPVALLLHIPAADTTSSRGSLPNCRYTLRNGVYLAESFDLAWRLFKH